MIVKEVDFKIGRHYRVIFKAGEVIVFDGSIEAARFRNRWNSKGPERLNDVAGREWKPRVSDCRTIVSRLKAGTLPSVERLKVIRQESKRLRDAARGEV